MRLPVLFTVLSVLAITNAHSMRDGDQGQDDARNMPDRAMPDRDRDMPDRVRDMPDRDMGGDEGGDRPPRVWTFAIGREWPPFEYLDTEKRAVVGLGVDMMHAACRVANQHCEFIFYKEYTDCWHRDNGISPGLAMRYFDACVNFVPIFERTLVNAFSHSYAREAPSALYVRNNDNLRIGDLTREANEISMGLIRDTWLDTGCLAQIGLHVNMELVQLFGQVDDLREALRSGQVRVAFLERQATFDSSNFDVMETGDIRLQCALGGGAAVMTRKDNQELLHWLNPAIDRVMMSPQYARMCYIWEEIFDRPTNCLDMNHMADGREGGDRDEA